MYKEITNRYNKSVKVLESIKDTLTKEQYETLSDSLSDLKYHFTERSYPVDLTTSGRLTAHIVEDAINSSNFDNLGFIQHITSRTHRYLQGEFFSLILSYIKTYSEYQDHMFDGRNQFVKDWCDKITSSVDDFKYVRGLEELKKDY